MTWCLTFLWLTGKVDILLDDVVSYILVVNWEGRDSVRRSGHYELRR